MRYINMWAFHGLHVSNLEILQKLRSAEDRQFGKNMDLAGTVSVGNEEVYVVGLRTDIWSPDEEDRQKVLNAIQKREKTKLRKQIKSSGRLNKAEKALYDEATINNDVLNMDHQQIDKSRLVVKLFKQSKAINWKGSIEEISTREVQNSIGSQRLMLYFVVILPKYDYIISIVQNNQRFGLMPVFSFNYYDEKNEKMWYIKLKQKIFCFGIDFIIESDGKKIGLIDGKLIALGNNAHIYLNQSELATDNRFLDLLTLFTATTGYHRSIRKNIKKRLNNISQHIVEDEELWLLKNPRRLTR